MKMNRPINAKQSKEMNDIIRNMRAGMVSARNITKEETHKHSTDLKNAAWKAGEDLINEIGIAFFKEPPAKKYPFFSGENKLLYSLLAESVKTFQNAFRLSEEGYYRSAFGELRDILELVMKIKLFYIDTACFKKWYEDPNELYPTTEMRSHILFRDSGLNMEIEKLSNALSNNRHCSSATLDSRGPFITNACYYRKDLFEKWCKHVIILKELCIKIINIQQSPKNSQKSAKAPIAHK